MADIIFRSYRPEVERKMKSAIDVGMNAVAEQAEGNAIKEITKLIYDTPPSPHYVRTGDLRNSITHAYDPSEQAAYVGANMEYAKYVEFGTSKMRARPFLGNAAQNYTDEYLDTLNKALKALK